MNKRTKKEQKKRRFDIEFEIDPPGAGKLLRESSGDFRMVVFKCPFSKMHLRNLKKWSDFLNATTANLRRAKQTSRPF